MIISCDKVEKILSLYSKRRIYYTIYILETDLNICRGCTTPNTPFIYAPGYLCLYLLCVLGRFGNSLELQYNSLSMLVKVYAKVRSFIVTCVLCFLPNSQIAILELPKSYEWLTFLKRCYWLVRIQ